MSVSVRVDTTVRLIGPMPVADDVRLIELLADLRKGFGDEAD
jgi:hypothetical protein